MIYGLYDSNLGRVVIMIKIEIEIEVEVKKNAIMRVWKKQPFQGYTLKLN